jgi:hypothetical protein
MKIVCNKNCRKCGKLNAKTDDKGYPWAWECLKFNERIPQERLERSKTFVR